MTHTGTMFTGAILAGAASGPMAQLFNEATLAIAVMGGLGGVTFALAVRRPLRDAIRPGFIGSGMAVGLGAIAPVVLNKMMGVDLDMDGMGLAGLASTAYIVGFAQERLTIFLTVEDGGKPDE